MSPSKTPKKRAAAQRSAARRADRILVTGASGFLGKHLVEALRQADALAGLPAREAKRPIEALVRQPSLHLSRWQVETVRGDVCDERACAEALAGVSEVYHVAGFVSRDPDEAGRMYRVHVEGTRTLLTAAARAGVRRVVVVSTSGTIAVSRDPDEIATEASPYRTNVVSRWPYYLSKIYQEQTALQIAQEAGLDVVVVNPSLLLGPGDERGSSTGDVEKVVRGKLPVIPQGGGVAFVDARDAALGCVLAMHRGRSGERYLLSASNLPLETFLGRVARLAGRPAPRAVLSPRTMTAAGRLIEAVYKRFDATPPLEAQSIAMAEHCWYCDASKAKAELGWQPRDAQDTLLDTVRDIQRRHNLTGRGAQARTA